MKIEEAVRILDPATTAAALYGLPHDEAVELVEAACRLAVGVLREKLGEAVSACNQAVASICEKLGAAEEQPLTLEELREMTMRGEGIYVANTDGRPLFRERKYCAAVLDMVPTYGGPAHIQAIYGEKLSLWEDDYGKTWVAYRRPPVEARDV